MDTVDKLMNDVGEWDVNKIKACIPSEALDYVLNVNLSRFVTYPDTPHWKGSTSGNFSAATAYQMASSSMDNSINMDWVWKLKIPQKLKGFLWLTLHGKLLTNSMRLKSGITDNANCPRCNHLLEDVEHLLRGCTYSRFVWHELMGSYQSSRAMLSPFNVWLKSNLHNSMDVGPDWGLIFAVTIWQIWKERNRKVFHDIAPSWQRTIFLTFNYVNEIKHAFSISLTSNRLTHVMVKWIPPSAGKIKLNIDGCARGDPGEGGFGGVFRDKDGSWLCGFFGKLDSCYSLETEMWGIYRGLTMVLEKGLHEVIIETDFILAEELLNKGPPSNCPFRSIVEDSRHLIRRRNCSIQHILREGNKCADLLANMGAEQLEPLVVVDEPPIVVRSQIVADMVGMAYRRI
ncbi:unnamed protein product [Camellia sinensis]